MNIRIASVVVTYLPDQEVVGNIRSVAAQSDKVFVIENLSRGELKEHVFPDNVEIIPSSINLGLAAALNLGISHALAEDYHWIATFDQDSTIGGNHFVKMFEGLNLSEDCCIGIVSCTYVDRETGYRKSFSDRRLGIRNGKFKLARTTMTSGSIMNVKAIRKCGYFISEMFIDQLDNEICLRFRKAGFLILENQDVSILHGVGKATQKKIGPLVLRPSNHSTLRRYYMARNRIFLYKKYFTFDIFWVIEDIYAFLKEMLKIALYEDRPTDKFKATLKGIGDGNKGRLGEVKQ